MRSRTVIFFTILFLLFLYTGTKAGNLLPAHSSLAWILSIVLFALMVGWQFVYRLEIQSAESYWFRFLAWGGSLSLGLWTTFMLFSIPVDIVYLFLSVLQNFGASEINPIHSRWMSLGLFGFSAGIVGLGFIETITGPKVKEVSVPIPDLPEQLYGIRIAQITDLHIGPTIRRGYVEQVVRQVMELEPDLIAVTGDLADGTPEALEQHLQPLAELKAPLGTYYITGNHEYYWGATQWLETARNLGFIPLINENRVVTIDGVNLLIAGVTDTSAHHFIPAHHSDPQKAAVSHQACLLKLLLAHRPDSCFDAEPAGFDLQLSGHTHGGQFFPWNLIVRLVHKYYRGLNRHGNMWVYVNAGTGYWGPAHRFAVPSEITLLRIVPDMQYNLQITA